MPEAYHLHHRPSALPTQALKLMSRCNRLSLPGRPGMSQVMPAEILDACPLKGRIPGFRAGRVDWIAPLRKNSFRMLSCLSLEDGQRHIVQRHGDRAAILGIVAFTQACRSSRFTCPTPTGGRCCAGVPLSRRTAPIRADALATRRASTFPAHA